MFKLAPFAALGLISLAVIPVVRSEQHVVIVGGPGILKYDPPSVVCRAYTQHRHLSNMITGCSRWRYHFVYLQTEEPYRHTINVGQPVHLSARWL